MKVVLIQILEFNFQIKDAKNGHSAPGGIFLGNSNHFLHSFENKKDTQNDFKVQFVAKCCSVRFLSVL